jgi:glycosyltransferase involved in cell wall biosynthesis
METLELIYTFIWLGAWLIFALYLFLKNSMKIRDNLGGFPLNELTVVIPFRDEKPNLNNLLSSILSQIKQPAHYIFVDDHSNDGGSNLIHEQLRNSGISYQIMTLHGDLSGKKYALMEAVKSAQTEYIQTMDADVWFDKNFFANLPYPQDFEMMILPVRMVGNDAFTKIMELEYGTFQILQAGVSRERPLMASGANLIVKREVYLQTNDLSKHAHRSSGDDQYALVQFIKNEKKITTFFDSDLAIFTHTPPNLSALLTQRARWMGNNTQGNDIRATVISIFIFAVNLSFLYLILKGLLFGFSPETLPFLFVKFFADFVVYFNWFKRNATWKLAPYLPLLSLLYPIYLILLLGKYLSRKKQIWKDRVV